MSVYVVTAAGLPNGKGVIVCSTWADVLNALDEIVVQRCFGRAGDHVTIETGEISPAPTRRPEY